MDSLITFESGTTVNEAASILGIDKWHPVKEQCLDKKGKPITGLYYLENSETEEVISTKSIGKVYQESTHTDMLNFFTALIENNPFLRLNSGMVIAPGTQIILNAVWEKKLEVSENQIIEPSLVYILDHSALRANKIVQISQCLWCRNQLGMLFNRKHKQSISIRHSSSQSRIIEQAIKVYSSLEEELEENLALYRQWSKTYISKETFEKLVNALLNTNNAEVESYRVYTQIKEKFYNGVGCKGQTLWDFVNGVTEQLRDIEYKEIKRKVKSELLGSSYNRGLRAAKLAKEYVRVQV